MNKFVQWLCCLLHWLALLTQVPVAAQQQGLREVARQHGAAPEQPPPCIPLTRSLLPSAPLAPVSPAPASFLGCLFMALYILWVGLRNWAFPILTLGPLSLPHAISFCSHSNPVSVLPWTPAWPGAGKGEMDKTSGSKQTQVKVLC